MKKRPHSGRRAPAGDSGSGALAGIVGHELNNIAVPLLGFAEFALQSAAGNAPLIQSLDEMCIAIGRIKALASDLESLAQAGTEAAPVAIGECMPELPGARPIDWLASAATLVHVDLEGARRALAALALIAARGGSPLTAAPEWFVSLGRPARCAACGAAAEAKRRYLLVEVQGARPMPRDALRHPLGAARAGRRLTCAVLVHSAHCAGGHVLLDEKSGALGLAFPAA